MTRSPRSALPYSAALIGLLLLSACGKHEPAAWHATAPAETAAAKASAPAPPKAATASSSATTGASAAVAASTASSPAVTGSANAPLSVGKLTLGNAVDAAHEVTHASNSFAFNDKIIYASVATTGRSDGATLNAKWSYLEGNGQLISSISQALATDGPAVTTFMVQNPDLWPEGHYKIEISLDGKPVTTQNFEISKH